VRATIRRPLFGAAMALGGVLTVVVGLAILDERVRRQITALANKQSVAGEVSSSLDYVWAVAMVVLGAIQDQSIEHAPLTIFAVAAVALVLLLVRTRI
jgi:hypothetical protein